MRRILLAVAVLLAAVTFMHRPTQAVYCQTTAIKYADPDGAYGYCTSTDFHIVIDCINSEWSYVTLSGPVRNQPAMSTRYCTSGHPILVNRRMVP